RAHPALQLAHLVGDLARVGDLAPLVEAGAVIAGRRRRGLLAVEDVAPRLVGRQRVGRGVGDQRRRLGGRGQRRRRRRRRGDGHVGGRRDGDGCRSRSGLLLLVGVERI